MANRKLGRPTDQRMALLRNQVTNLIWYGRIETTLTRAKEVRSLASASSPSPCASATIPLNSRKRPRTTSSRSSCSTSSTTAPRVWRPAAM